MIYRGEELERRGNLSKKPNRVALIFAERGDVFYLLEYGSHLPLSSLSEAIHNG